MKTKSLLVVTAMFLILSAFGQRYTIELSFTALDSITYVQLDSIMIMNQTQGGDTMLYWPDTTLTIECIPEGVIENNNKNDRFQVFQNYPNPVVNQTTISMFIPEKDEVVVVITDIMGRVILNSKRVLERGTHSFSYSPGGGIYFFNAFWQGNNSSIKIVSPGNGSYRKSKLEYTGNLTDKPELKKLKAVQNFLYNCDDDLLYIGYAETVQGFRGSDVIKDTPENDTLYTFEITEGIPCADVPIVVINWVDYRTVQIGTQCWLKNNINVGTMINGIQGQLDNGIIEKYCFDDDPSNCLVYGGLYQWREAMKYKNSSEPQGICPSGWHIPTDDEWKQLEGEADSEFDYPDPEWHKQGYRGYDVGENLKTRNGWDFNNGTNAVGFSFLPSGTRRFDGVFLNQGSYSGIWSSSQAETAAWYRFTESPSLRVSRTFNSNEMGRPIRCLKDE